MKKLLFLFTFLFSINLIAQQNPCVPLASNQDSTFGLWPDTIQNLPPAYSGTYYETYVQLKTPTVVSEVPGAPADVLGVPIGNLGIDSITLIQANGLPPGLTMVCSSPSCSYPGDDVGCVNLFGTTTSLGVYDLEFVVDGYVYILLAGGVLSMSGVTGDYIYIDGYKVVVNSAADIDLVYSNNFEVLQNIPNPFTGKTKISFNNINSENISFSVYNIIGELVYYEDYKSKIGINEINLSYDDLGSPGIYFYSLNNGDETITKRMILSEK